MSSRNPSIPKPSYREAAQKKHWNIIAGDKVQVIGRHPESGKQGIVKQVFRKRDRVIVQGVNLSRKNVPGDKERGIKGTTVMMERTIHYSNLNLVDPLTNKPTRVFRKVLEDGSKVRVSKASGAVIPKPKFVRERPPNSVVTQDDTLDKDVWKVTYQA